MRPRRQSLDNLSAAERRVLEAFYRGALTAGQLSGALAVARRHAPVQAFDHLRARQPAPEPVPELQLVA